MAGAVEMLNARLVAIDADSAEECAQEIAWIAGRLRELCELSAGAPLADPRREAPLLLRRLQSSRALARQASLVFGGWSQSQCVRSAGYGCQGEPGESWPVSSVLAEG